MKTLKIISTILYVLFAITLIILFLAVLSDLYTSEDGWAKVGGVIMLALTLIGSLAFLIPITLSIIGLCLTRKAEKKSALPNGINSYKKSKAHFSIILLLSLLTPVLNLIAYLIVLQI